MFPLFASFNCFFFCFFLTIKSRLCTFRIVSNTLLSSWFFLILTFIPRVLGSACLVECRLFIPCPCIGLPPLCSSRFLHIVFTLVSHCWLRFCVSLSVYVCVYGYRLFVSRVRSMENVIVFCLFRNVKFHNFAIFDKIAACSLLLFPLLFYGTNEERKCWPFRRSRSSALDWGSFLLYFQLINLRYS